MNAEIFDRVCEIHAEIFICVEVCGNVLGINVEIFPSPFNYSNIMG
jgi:hypothetical protein